MAVVTILASIHFIDKKVASEIWHLTSTQPVIHNHIKEIPDKLPQLVAIGTSVMCIACCLTFRKNGFDRRARFLQLAAIALPSAYLIKMFLQYAFGRTSIRTWLLEGKTSDFRWFHPLENGSFPSGHAVVATAFLTALWLYYPRLRPLVVALLLALSMALVLTSYHFVSDVIAGIACGALITLGIEVIISKICTSKS